MKKILLLLFCILFLNLVSALQISPTNLNANITKNEIVYKNIIITNDKSYILNNIKIESSHVSMSTVDKLNPGESKNVTLTVTSPTVGTFTETITILAFTKINCSLLSPQTHEIDLQSSSYLKKYICKNDFIKFNNKYSFPINLKVFYSNNNLFNEQSISMNGSHVTPAFSTVGNYYFRDAYSVLFYGEIEVSEESKLLHSSSDDGILNLNLKVSYMNTQLSIIPDKTNYTMNYNESKSGYFILKNTGNEIANNIVIVCDWFSFDKNNFNLNPDESKAINFIIYPYVFSTNETDKTYTKTIKIKSDNSPEITQNIQIYIPYANILGSNESLSEFWKDKKRFCDAYPTSQLCISEPVVIYRETPVYHCANVLQNMSPETLQKYMEGELSKEGMIEVLSNLMKQFMDSINASIYDINNNTVNIKEEQSDIKSYISGIKNSSIVIVALVFIIMIGVIGGYFMYKMWHKKVATLGQIY